MVQIDFTEVLAGVLEAYNADNEGYIEQENPPDPFKWLVNYIPVHIVELFKSQGAAYAQANPQQRIELERMLIDQATATIVNNYSDGHEEWLERYETVTLVQLNEDEQAQLYRRYPSQSSAQGVYLEVDSAAAEWHYNPELGNAVPQAVWSGRTLRFHLASGVIPTATAANKLMAAYEREVRRVAAGIEEYHDGSNWCGTLTVDARNAASILEDEFSKADFLEDKDRVSEYSAEEWFTDNPPIISATATPEEINLLARRLQDKLPETVVISDLYEYLYRLKGEGLESMSAQEAAERWNMPYHSVMRACREGRIGGAFRAGGIWRIPRHAKKPADRRRQSKRPPMKLPILDKSTEENEDEDFMEFAQLKG